MEKAPQKQYSELSKAAKRRERRKRVDKSVPAAEKPVQQPVEKKAAPAPRAPSSKHHKKAVLVNQVVENTIIQLDETNARENWLAHNDLSSKLRNKFHDLQSELQLATPEDQPEAPGQVELPPDFERLEFEMHHGFIYGQCKHCCERNTKFALSIFRLDEFMDHVANGHTMRRAEYVPGTGMLPVEPAQVGFVYEDPVQAEPPKLNAEAPVFLPKPAPTKTPLKAGGFTVYSSSLGWH